MRVVFMGTSSFAVPCLKALVHTEYEIITVVTQPDRPKGRGNQVYPSPVKELCLELGLPVFQPDKVKNPENVAYLKKLAPELIVVVAYGQILSSEILSLPTLGSINVHGSLLPAYRGSAPIHWAIINGEKETGVSTMYMTPGLDSGDVILQQKVPIGATTTVGQLHDNLAEEGAQLLLKTLDLIAQGKAPRIPQDETKVSFAPPLTRENEKINWTQSNQQILNLIRGMNPWPGAYTTLENKILKIWAGECVPDEKKVQPGTIIAANKNGILVKCGEGGLKITEIQPQGKKKMSAAAFICGNKIDLETILGNEEQ
ncbi:methionyl-tRNA formyltransferase [Bacillota bacterium LX-D]|nr:methionyl-tRNA formyltransferase [Bacillota bacterium LX-D]